MTGSLPLPQAGEGDSLAPSAHFQVKQLAAGHLCPVPSLDYICKASEVPQSVSDSAKDFTARAVPADGIRGSLGLSQSMAACKQASIESPEKNKTVTNPVNRRAGDYPQRGTPANAPLAKRHSGQDPQHKTAERSRDPEPIYPAGAPRPSA
jgi:hypothetical protein